jgi:hypothetical protein
MIPKILHQTARALHWDERHLMVRNKKRLSGFEHRFWTDDDNLALITSVLPHRADLFQSLPSGVVRADIARCLYLHQYGGIYADTDYKFFKAPPTNFFQNRAVLAVEEINSPDLKTAKIGNALMASEPEHPLWINFVESAFERFLNGQKNPLHIAGPHALTIYLQQNPSFSAMITVLDQNVIYPPFNTFKLSAQNAKDAIGVHLCWGSWRDKDFVQRIKNHIRRGLSAVA